MTLGIAEQEGKRIAPFMQDLEFQFQRQQLVEFAWHNVEAVQMLRRSDNWGDSRKADEMARHIQDTLEGVLYGLGRLDATSFAQLLYQVGIQFCRSSVNGDECMELDDIVHLPALKSLPPE